MTKKWEESVGGKDLVSGLLLLLLLYFLACILVPMFAPLEYQTAAGIRKFCPFLPAVSWIFRLLSLLAVFSVAWLVRLVSANCRQKRPNWAAACFLLLPPVFLAGTRVWPAAPLILGSFLLFSGILMLLRPQKRFQRWGGLGFLAAGSLSLFLLNEFPIPLREFWFFPIFPFAALLITAFVEVLERRGVDVGLWLSRLARVFSYTLTLFALLLLLPSLLHLIHMDFPISLSPYQSERLYRPIVVLLVPLLWFHLLRLTPVLERKLTFFSVGIGFLLLMFPLALPWQLLVDIAPEYMIRKLPEISKGEALCFADAATAPVLSEVLHCEVRVVGTATGEIAPPLLAKEIREALPRGDVILGYEGHRLDEYQPSLPGIHYRAGKRVYCRFYGGKVK